MKKIIEKIKRLFILPINNLQQSKNINVAVISSNIKFFLKNTNLKVCFHKEYGLFSITDGIKKHYFGNLLRGLKMYSGGIDKRAEKLFKSYSLDNITFTSDDIVIDCGANYADLWLSLKGKINPSSYITFEPGIVEHECVKLNSPDGVHNRLGLDNKNSKVKFYVNERFGDSSLVEPLDYTHTIDVKTVSLSSYIAENNISKIKLFKLEAEGYEPEILDGAKSILDKISYIAIDGGFERGLNEEETYSYLDKHLRAAGFELVARHAIKEFRALYKNTLS